MLFYLRSWFGLVILQEKTGPSLSRWFARRTTFYHEVIGEFPPSADKTGWIKLNYLSYTNAAKSFVSLDCLSSSAAQIFNNCVWGGACVFVLFTRVCVALILLQEAPRSVQQQAAVLPGEISSKDAPALQRFQRPSQYLLHPVEPTPPFHFNHACLLPGRLVFIVVVLKYFILVNHVRGKSNWPPPPPLH